MDPHAPKRKAHALEENDDKDIELNEKPQQRCRQDVERGGRIDAGPSAERRETIDSAPLIVSEKAVAPWRGAAPQAIPGIPINYYYRPILTPAFIFCSQASLLILPLLLREAGILIVPLY